MVSELVLRWSKRPAASDCFRVFAHGDPLLLRPSGQGLQAETTGIPLAPAAGQAHAGLFTG